MQGPLEKYGPPLLAYVTRVYQKPWMSAAALKKGSGIISISAILA